MTDLCRCDWKEKIQAIWERLQSTIYGIKLNGQRLIPDGQGIIDIDTSDLIEIDDTVRNNALPVENRAIKNYVDSGDATLQAGITALDTSLSAEIDELNDKVDDLGTATGDAITSSDISSSASTVTITHKHLDEAVDTDSMPVASTVHAGVINASDYQAFLQLQEDVDDLKGAQITYSVAFNTPTPTQEQITQTFRSSYPTVDLIAGIKVADYMQNLAYQYDGTIWVSQQFSGTIPIATASIVGGVKSSTTNGEIAVNVGGTMSLNGYDFINDRLDDIDGTGGFIEQLESEIEALQSSVTGYGTRLNTAEDNIQMLDSDVADLSNDVTTIDGQISAINTAVSGMQTTIGSMQTAIAGKENTLNADQKRKITISTADPTGGSDGDIWLKYEA